MHRYYFHSEDGQDFCDEEGTELPNDEAARIEAARVLAQLINEHPANLWRDNQLRVRVTDEAGVTLFILDVAAIRSPAAAARSPVEPTGAR